MSFGRSRSAAPRLIYALCGPRCTESSVQERYRAFFTIRWWNRRLIASLDGGPFSAADGS
jgi:hypothetical protein